MTLTIELKRDGRLIGGAIVTDRGRFAGISDYQVEAVEKAAPDVGVTTDFREVFGVEGMRDQTVWALVAEVAAETLKRRRRHSG